jgi:hypothetical protein
VLCGKLLIFLWHALCPLSGLSCKQFSSLLCCLLPSHYFIPLFLSHFSQSFLFFFRLTCLYLLLFPFFPFSPPSRLRTSLSISRLPSVHSKLSVDVTGGRIPLFSVDLKVAEATADSPAKFVYSSPADSIFNSVMSHFDKTFEALKGNLISKNKSNNFEYIPYHDHSMI